MAEKSTRTLYGLYRQVCANLGIPFTLAKNTTLNELLSIQANRVPDAGVYPSIGYMSLGNGGLAASLLADGNLAMIPKVFQATNAAPYSPIPLVLRALGNDLAPDVRKNYALRRIETRNGNPYIAYYLKRLDKTQLNAGMFLTTVVDGVKTTVPFVPDSSVLHPVPPAVSTAGVVTADGSYVSASAPLNVVLDAYDTTELLNVFSIIYQDPNAAVISELALCSGLDLTVQITDPGNASFNMVEAIAVQVSDFVNIGAPLQFNADGVKFSLDIGASEPLYIGNGGNSNTVAP
jgi:hypothetical protein